LPPGRKMGNFITERKKEKRISIQLFLLEKYSHLPKKSINADTSRRLRKIR
jgi:hypothetical protein